MSAHGVRLNLRTCAPRYKGGQQPRHMQTLTRKPRWTHPGTMTRRPARRWTHCRHTEPPTAGPFPCSRNTCFLGSWSHLICTATLSPALWGPRVGQWADCEVLAAHPVLSAAAPHPPGALLWLSHRGLLEKGACRRSCCTFQRMCEIRNAPWSPPPQPRTLSLAEPAREYSGPRAQAPLLLPLLLVLC